MIWYSKDIAYSEMIFSQTAARHDIDNTPPPDVIDNMVTTSLALQAIRSYFDKPLIVSSGYRCEKLNRLIGGSKNSHHIEGWAADFVVYQTPIQKVLDAIPDIINFDQMINEYGKWIHLSVKDSLRGQILDKR